MFMSASEIKQAALQLFAQHGYEGTALAEIASRVGIKKPSIYAHFASKDELFLTVFKEVVDEHILHSQELLTRIGHLSIEEKLYRILYDACSYYVHSKEKISFLKRCMLFPPDALKTELRARFIQSEAPMSAMLRTIFTEAIEHGIIKEENVEDLLASYYCLLDGNFIQIFYYGLDSFERRLKNVWRIYWSGLIQKE